LEEAGEQDIYKINLLEAMLMAQEAWKEVTAATIAHCWNHTKIQPSSTPIDSGSTPVSSTTTSASSYSPSGSPQYDPKAWAIVQEFATSEMGLPQAEAKLESYLGTCYKEVEWRVPLKAVMDAEND